jgi:septal ring factor EnvC (AmiA/AmiB activator)
MAAERLDVERIAKLEAQMEDLKTDVADVKQDIKELHSRITTGNREIMDHLDKRITELATADSEQHTAMAATINQMKSRVDTLESWRWMIVGGALALGYLFSNIDITRFFK